MSQNPNSAANYFFTSESVSEGHPDKVCDQISDGILDALLAQDPDSRVACETFTKTGLVIIGGEITSKANIEYADIARDVIKKIGYDSGDLKFDYRSCGVMTAIEKQSPDISQGVSENEGLHTEQGAGDQGMMFGYACDETDNLMPATITYSHQILQQLAKLRKEKHCDFLRPDAKSQVTAKYVDGKFDSIDSIVVSTQHAPHVTHDKLKEYVIEESIKKVIPQNLLQNCKYYINPTGKFEIGGPHGDCGLTGRKIIVDTYGGHGAHGGGAFSGKDPSKVDRSAAYMGRYIAKNIVAAGMASKCTVQLAYAIGVADPMSVFVETYGTSNYSYEELEKAVRANFGLKPKQIIDSLQLKKPIYLDTAAYGHFGRKGFSWENTDKVEALKS